MMRDLGRLKATPWLFFAALIVVQNVFVGPWTVLPAYLPIVLGAAVLQPPLREAVPLDADHEDAGNESDDGSGETPLSVSAPASVSEPETHPQSGATTSPQPAHLETKRLRQ